MNTLLLVVALLSAGPFVGSPAEPAPPEPCVATTAPSASVQRITDDVYLLPGSPSVGNVLIVDGGEQGLLLVDSYDERGVDALLLALAAVDVGVDAGDEELQDPETLTRALGRVRWVVNTHYHEDHVGSNALLAEWGATLVAQREGRRLMHAAEGVPELGFVPARIPDAGLPALTFEHGLTLRLGAQRVRLLHVPGAHTGGDTLVHLPDANVLHVGDIVELGAWPFLDMWNGGSLAGTLQACDTILDLSDEHTRIVPGHGEPLDRAEVRAYHDVLALLAVRARKAVEEGLDLEAFRATGPFDDVDPRWGGPDSTTRFGWLIWEDARRAADEG